MRVLWKSIGLTGFAVAGAAAVLAGRPELARVEAEPPAASGAGAAAGGAVSDVRYDRDIRPILSNKCFLCHGPDPSTRQAELRLDLPETATAAREGGGAAIVPGDLEASLLWQRVNAANPDDRMPPPDSEKHALSDQEKALFRRWIEAGAAYEPHWSFVAPVRPAPPEVAGAAWAQNPIDRFIAARLADAGLAPGPEADRAALLRRVFLDLTGLPPTVQELDEFLADERPDAYERWVDRLLSQEPYVSRYAERMAVPWLDQARYGDTSGIHMDAGRSIWPWRDWVLGAYRTNMPFDQFVVEQLAGDLLPEATVQQKVATGFHRNHVTSDEGGAIPEEYLVEYAVDRVATTGSVFLGLTLGCARCHDHKFDPVTQSEFYSVFAFFNSIDEPGLYSQLPNPNRAFEPVVSVPTPEQAAEEKRLTEAAANARTAREQTLPKEEQQRQAYIAEATAKTGVRWETPELKSADSAPGGATLRVKEDGSVLALAEIPGHDEYRFVLRTDSTGLRMLLLEALADASFANGRVGRAANGNAVLTGISCEAVSVANPQQRKPVKFYWAWGDIEQETGGDFRVTNVLEGGNGVGWGVDAHRQDGNRLAVFLSDEPFGFEGGTELHVSMAFRAPYPQHALGRVRLRVGTIADEGIKLLPEATGGWYMAGPFTGPVEELFEQKFGPEQGERTLETNRTFGPDYVKWLFEGSVVDGASKKLPEGPNVHYFGRRVYSPTEREVELSLGSDDGLRVFVNGAEVFSNKIDRMVRPDQDRTVIKLKPGRNDIVFKVVNTGGGGGFYHRLVQEPARLDHDLAAALWPEDARPARAEAAMAVAWGARFSPTYRQFVEQIAAIESELSRLREAMPITMVMAELPKPRAAYVLKRGVYDQPDKERKVERGIPAALGKLPEDAPQNRLGLAQWIVSDANPLTARVTVNRLWEQFFGVGIVTTSEDFGMQGEWPSHPELLDWLAVEFREGGWDVRALVQLIVTSRTYRQSSRVREEARQVDPENRLLAFFPRQRLGAEQIRDGALYVAGLLVEKLGGPSVKPYQPPGLWEEVSMLQSNTRTYEVGEGEDLWRRSMYIYWKRAAPPPSMLTFDAPTREFCVTRRDATNTPLQALVLWNDEQFVEAARVLAARVLAEPAAAENADAHRLRRLVRACAAREPTARQLEVMAEALQAFRERYAAAPDDAAALVGIGRAPVPATLELPELAAWTMIANAVLSADAAITKH